MTLIVPAAAMLAAGTLPRSCVEDIKVVATPAPFSVMTLPVTNPNPVAVRLKAGLPAVTALGDIEPRLNVCDPAPVTFSCIASEVVVSGFITRILTVPAVATCAAETAVVNFVLDKTEVGCAIPFHRICVPAV